MKHWYKFLFLLGLRKPKLDIKVVHRYPKEKEIQDNIVVTTQTLKLSMNYDTGDSALEDFLKTCNKGVLQALLQVNEKYENYEACCLIKIELENK